MNCFFECLNYILNTGFCIDRDFSTMRQTSISFDSLYLKLQNNQLLVKDFMMLEFSESSFSLELWLLR